MSYGCCSTIVEATNQRSVFPPLNLLLLRHSASVSEGRGTDIRGPPEPPLARAPVLMVLRPLREHTSTILIFVDHSVRMTISQVPPLREREFVSTNTDDLSTHRAEVNHKAKFLVPHHSGSLFLQNLLNIDCSPTQRA